MICNRIRQAIEAVEILGPRAYSFNGGPPQEAPVSLGLADVYQTSPLAVTISDTLYFNCYAVPFDPNVLRTVDDYMSSKEPAFEASLSLANRSTNGWQRGWIVTHRDAGGKIRIRKGSHSRTASPGDYQDIPAEFQRGPWPEVMLRRQRESIDRQPVFYYMYGDAFQDQYSDFQRVRFYFHCTPKGAAPLMQFLTERLNAYQLPFQMKCGNSPAGFDRTDGSVLYLLRRHFHIGADIVRDAALKLESHFKPDIPLFSGLLLPGVGIADDPGANDSFGTSRCRAVAEGLIDAWCAGATEPADRVKFVADRFAQLGYDIERPWLGKGCEDILTRCLMPQSRDTDTSENSGAVTQVGRSHWDR